MTHHPKAKENHHPTEQTTIYTKVGITTAVPTTTLRKDPTTRITGKKYTIQGLAAMEDKIRTTTTTPGTQLHPDNQLTTTPSGVSVNASDDVLF